MASTSRKVMDIAPGIGNKGIETARRLLMERCRVAAVEAVGHADKIRIIEESGVPLICVQFDGHTTLTVRLWDPRCIGQGFDPWWHMDTSRHFDWHVPACKQPRPLNWNSEVELILQAIQFVLTTVNFVEAP